MERLLANDLTRDGLAALLAGFQLPGTVRAWLEAADGWALAYWEGVGGRLPWCGAGREPVEEKVEELLPRLTAGRVFAPAGELRWRVLPALGETCCRTVYLGDRASAPAGLKDRPEGLIGLHGKDVWVPLWGELSPLTREEGAWVELKVPHRFRYPVQLTGASGTYVGVQALVRHWADRRGEVQFVRLCDLEPYNVNRRA